MSEVIYKIRVNTPCRLFIDEEEVKGLILAENKLTKITLPEGEYLRKVVAVEDNTIFHETGIALSGASKLDIITLDIRGLVDAKRKALPHYEKFKIGDLLYEAIGDSITVAVAGYMDENATEVVIPERIIYGKYTYNVRSIAASAFEGFEKLKSITIPNSITSIGDNAFSSCKNLTSITIPNSVTNIGLGVFYWCKGLTSVIIPNSVENIGLVAFSSCESLTSITIPNGVEKIDVEAFKDCKGLTSITVPNSITCVKFRAFKGCNLLTSITYQGTKAQWKEIELVDGWKDNVPANVVHCTDGDIEI